MKKLKRFESIGNNLDKEDIKDILIEITDEYPQLSLEIEDNFTSFVAALTGFDKLFLRFDDQKSKLEYWVYWNKLISLIIECCERVSRLDNVDVKIIGLNAISELTIQSDKVLIGIFPKST